MSAKSFSRVLVWYSVKLDTHPLTTKSITSGIVAGSGDTACQVIVHLSSRQHNERGERVRIDKLRTFRFLLLGAVLVAPAAHYWYMSLLRYFPAKTMKAALQRTFFDQVIFAPLFIPTFMTSLMMLQGEAYNEITTTIQVQYTDLVLKNWIMWTPTQLLNFRFVPARFQVLFSNIVALIWNAYFSFKVNEGANDEYFETKRC